MSWLDWNPVEWGEDRAAAQHAGDLIEDALRRANEADGDAAADLRVAQLVGQGKASVKALGMSDDRKWNGQCNASTRCWTRRGRSS